MKQKFIEKLRWHLHAPLAWTQADVVYVLVLVRKLLEEHKGVNPHPYPSLSMYCDWVVHSELDRRDARTLVKEVDDHLMKIIADANNQGEDPVVVSAMQEISNIFTLRRFRADLGRLLNDCGIHRSVSTDDGEWLNFQKAYVAVVDGCPLSFEAQNSGLRAVDKLVLNVRNALLIKPGERVPVDWELWFQDKRVLAIPGDIG